MNVFSTKLQIFSETFKFLDHGYEYAGEVDEITLRET